MTEPDYTEANRESWNETAGLHARSQMAKLLESFANPDFTTFDVVEEALLTRVRVEGKRVVQAPCNNGRELLCLLRRGATSALGVDIAEGFLAQAEELTAATGLGERVEFLRSEVSAIPSEYDGRFDLFYVTVGSLGWMPRIDDYLQVVQRLLAPGGHLVVYEMHPMLDMFDEDKGLEVRHSYFRTEPFEMAGEPDYFDPSQTVASRSFWFHHKLGDVLGSCLRHGLAIEHFEEFEHDISNSFRAFEAFEKRPPMCYALIARKG